MTNDEWLTPYERTRPYDPRPCEICGKVVDGPFRYKQTGELAHMNCIINPWLKTPINPQPPKKDDEDLTWAILSDISSTLSKIRIGLVDLVVLERERNDMLRDAYGTKETKQ